MSILSKSVKPLLGRLDFQSLKHIRWTDVKYKLAFGFGLLILLSALSTYFSITFLADMKQQMDHLVSQSAAKVKITGQLKSDLLAVGHAEKRLILVKTSDLKDQQVAVISAAKDRISAGMEALALIADRDADEDLSGTLDEFRETWFSYLDVHSSVVEHSSKNSNVRAQSMSSKEASPAYRNLMKQVDGLLKKATLDEERNLEAAKVAQSNANLSSDLYEAIMLFTREENTWAMAADEKETAKAARNMVKLNKDINKWLQQLQESKGNLTMVVNQVVKGWHQYRENVGDSNNIYERLMNMDRYAKDLIRIEKQMVQLRKFNRSSNNGAARKATAAVAHAKQLRQLKALLIDMQLNERAILASDNRMFMGVTTGQSKKIGRDVAAIFEELKQSLAYGLVSELEKAFANYSDLHFKVARINEENGNVKAFQLSTLAAAPLADRAEALLDRIIVSAEESMIADQESTAAAYQQAVIMTLAFSIISVVIGVVVALWIARGISKGLSRLVNIAKRVQIYGDFSLRTGIDSQDEIGSVARAFDALLDQLQAVLNETNQVLASIARGEFSDRVSVDLEGDLATLKTGVNESASSVDNTMQALEQLMVALGNFDFSARLDNSVEGELKEQVDASMERMELAITEVRQVMQAVAEGDFDQRVDSDLLGDMGVLKSAINDSLDELQEAIHETSEVVAMQSNGDMTARIVGNYGGTLGSMKDSLNQSAGNLEHTLSEVSAVAGHVTSMAGEVAQVSADLSTRTQSQASSLEETAASMEQLSATVIENADHAEQAKSMAEEALQLATNSAGISRRATDSMGQISASSKQMAEIIELIDSIAFQTNLLALNASVEAARAGEQGRGFAVVATEVRELAQKTADASKDIKELIEVNLSRIADGSRYVDESGEAMMAINRSIGEVAEFVVKIANASAEQRSSIQQVSAAVTSMDSVTQQNGALVDQTSNSAVDLNSQAKTMMDRLSGFKLS